MLTDNPTTRKKLTDILTTPCADITPADREQLTQLLAYLQQHHRVTVAEQRERHDRYSILR
jgi:hypothetical protein